MTSFAMETMWEREEDVERVIELRLENFRGAIFLEIDGYQTAQMFERLEVRITLCRSNEEVSLLSCRQIMLHISHSFEFSSLSPLPNPDSNHHDSRKPSLPEIAIVHRLNLNRGLNNSRCSISREIRCREIAWHRRGGGGGSSGASCPHADTGINF